MDSYNREPSLRKHNLVQESEKKYTCTQCNETKKKKKKKKTKKTKQKQKTKKKNQKKKKPTYIA